MKDLEVEIEELNEEIEKLNDTVSKKDVEIRGLFSELTSLEEDLELNDVTTDNPEDCRRSIFFALEELKDIQQGNCSIDEKVRDLTIRYCRFI